MSDDLERNGPRNGGSVSLREFILRILDERDKALALQAKEYERRLTDLNHAHQEALRVQHTYLTTDKFEDWQKHVVEDLDALKSFRGKATFIAAGVATVGGVLGAGAMRLILGGG